jgi:hypothetical protein
VRERNGISPGEDSGVSWSPGDSDTRGERPSQALLDAVEGRRRVVEQSLWGVPAISLAAQAFLFSTGLASETTSAARLVVGSVGLATAFGTVLVMFHQGSRLLVMRDWVRWATEEERTIDALKKDLEPEPPTADKPSRWGLVVRVGTSDGLSGWDPIRTWLLVLFAFALVDVFVIVAAAVALSGGDDLFSSG